MDIGSTTANFYGFASQSGIAARGNYTNSNGVVHTYFIYKQAGGITPGQCLQMPPQVVRDAVPRSQTVFLSSIVSEAERQAINQIIKSQSAPFTFSKTEAFVVDNFYDVNTNKWLAFSGKCKPNDYIPWGDYNSCCDDREPNYLTGANLEYCTAVDMRADLVCTPGSACSNVNTVGALNCTPPTARSRSCFYDGVYNNHWCTAKYTGCIYESVPAPTNPTEFGCRNSGQQCGGGAYNLLRNADFEAGQYYAGKVTYVFTPGSVGLYSWVITSGAVKSQTTTSVPAADGNYSIQLNAVGSGSALQQWVALDDTAIRQYTLTFKASSQPNQATSPIIVTLMNSDNQAISSQTFTIPTTASVSYATYTWRFNSNLGAKYYILQFKTADLKAGAIVDEVKLCAGEAVDPDAINPNNICNIPPTTIQLYTGWDVFPTLPRPTLTYSLRGTTFTATVFLPGETQTRRLGMHFKYPGTPAGLAECKAGPTVKYASFGNLLLSQPACNQATRQGITGYTSALDLAKADLFVSRPATMNGVSGQMANLTATGVQAGIWKFEFSVRQGLRNDNSDLGVMWQSGTVYGVTINMTVCGITGRCAIGQEVLSNTNFDQGVATRSYSGSTLSNVGVGKGEYDLVNVNSPSPITSWKINAGTILWNSHSLSLKQPPVTYESIGLLPGSSVSQSFTVPSDYSGYELTFYATTNPWNSAATRQAQSFHQLTVEVKNSVNGGFSTPSQTFQVIATPGTGVGEIQVFKYNWIAGQIPGANSRSFTVTFSLAGTPQSGIVNPATYNYGVLIGLPNLCTSVTPAVLGNTDYCGGFTNHLQNSFFTPTGATAGEASSFVPTRVGSNRITPWAITVGEIDHIFAYWQQPAGAHYSIDMSGSTTGMFLATIQQQFTLPAGVAQYTLKYALSGNPDGPPPEKHLRIQIVTTSGKVIYDNNGNIATFSTAGLSKQNMGWVEKLIPFTSVADSSTYIVKFSSLDDTAFGPAIGNAFVCALAPNTNAPDLRPKVCNSGRTANAVSNGDFESLSFTNNLPWSVIYAGSVGLTSWAVTSGTVEVYTAAGWKPYSGKNTIDMDGVSAGSIRQTLNLPGGYPWTLSFAMTGNPGQPPKTKTLQVTLYRSSQNMAPIITKVFTYDSTARDTKDNMNYQVQSLSFTTDRTNDLYILEFKSLTPGSFGMVIDDVRVCSPQVLDYPPTGPAPVTDTDTEPSVWTVTADNTFELYIDGIEYPPSNAAAISRDGGCKGKTMSGAQAKYCCDDAASTASPRCDWTKSETFNASIKSTGSIVAIHVVNFHHGGNPTWSDANPAALLVGYTNNGRTCGVSDSEDWLCSFTLTDTEKNGMSWIQYNYDDGGSQWIHPTGLGTNKAGTAVWTSSAAPFKTIPEFAQWIWGAKGTAGSYSEMWCRARVPNLYC